jgi:hypothetical protein
MRSEEILGMMIHPVKPVVLVGVDLPQTSSRQLSVHRTSLKVPSAPRLCILHHPVAFTSGEGEFSRMLEDADTRRHSNLDPSMGDQ